VENQQRIWTAGFAAPGAHRHRGIPLDFAAVPRQTGTADVKFDIYHREREYAREMGDPKLTEVDAASKKEAEHLTSHLGLTGTWAVSQSSAKPGGIPAPALIQWP
jgi:hypothetical protein